MSDASVTRRRRRIWRLVVAAGLIIGIGSMIRTAPPRPQALGEPGTPASAKSLASGFEITDIGSRSVSFILAIMAATTAVVIGIVFAMVWRFDVHRNEVVSVLTSEQTAQITPPAPQLQQDPFADLARNQSREARLLRSYGWITADHSLARIPIDRAMALSVGKSLDAPP
jgi:hypothetical protein